MPTTTYSAVSAHCWWTKQQRHAWSVRTERSCGHARTGVVRCPGWECPFGRYCSRGGDKVVVDELGEEDEEEIEIVGVGG